MVKRSSKMFKKPHTIGSAFAFVVLVGIAGSVLLLSSHAATVVVSLQAENGSLATGAARVADSTASGNAAVQFNTFDTTGGTTSFKLCTARDGSGGVPSDAFPAAPCTGIPSGTVLTKVPSQATSGPGWKWNGYAVVPTASGTASAPLVISGVDSEGGINTNVTSFSNILIKDSKAECAGINDGCIITGSNVTVQDTEIGGMANGTTYVSGGTDGVKVYGSNVVLKRLNIHHVQDGFKSDGTSETIVDSYVHDLSWVFNSDAHSDGSQTEVNNNPDNLLVTHNNLASGNDCGVFLQSGQHVTITNNYFLAETSGSAHSQAGVCGGGSATGGPVVVQNNFFSNSGFSGPIATNPFVNISTCGNKYVSGAAVDGACQ